MARRTDLRQESLQEFMHLFGLIKKALREQLQDTGTTPVGPLHLRLVQLCQQDAGITQQTLADITGRDKAQIARLVKELIEAGLLARTPHPEDGRSHLLQTTTTGKQAVKTLEKAQQAVSQQLFAEMPADELQAFRDQLGRLQGRLREL